VNYPWDAIQDRHPLDRLVYEISVDYASKAPYIGASTEFAQGVTNGFDWYQVLGGMQDWGYRTYGDLQLTIEVSGTKWPSFEQMGYYYEQNRPALYSFMEKVHQGAGFAMRTPGVNGEVSIVNAQGANLGTFKFRNSEFYKVLPAGDYRFEIKTPTGGTSIQVSVLANRVNPNNGNYTILQ
jgi:carboxypeptidase D